MINIHPYVMRIHGQDDGLRFGPFPSIPFALLTKTNVESGDVSKQEGNLSHL